MVLEFNVEECSLNAPDRRGSKKTLGALFDKLPKDQVGMRGNDYDFMGTMEKLGLSLDEIMAFGFPPYEMAISTSKEEQRERDLAEAVVIGKLEGIIQQKLGQQLSVSNDYLNEQSARYQERVRRVNPVRVETKFEKE